MEDKWENIESAPRDGSTILGWRQEWGDWLPLRWKTNHRIVEAHRHGQNQELAESYFGDIQEWDDYDMAKEGCGPTHWFFVPDPPN